MIPRWIIFLLLLAGIAYVWARRNKAQQQLSSPNPNWNKSLNDIFAGGGLDGYPVTSDWQNQASSPYGRAEESYVPYGSAGWLDALSNVISTSIRKNAPAAGNNDDQYITWSPVEAN